VHCLFSDSDKLSSKCWSTLCISGKSDWLLKRTKST